MKSLLLDTSFVVDLFEEMGSGRRGPAMECLEAHRGDQLWISPVTYAEAMEGAHDPDTVRTALSRFRWQGIAHAQSERAARFQRRQTQRLGENDAWQVAVMQSMDAFIVGQDHAFERLGNRYIRHTDYA